MPLTVLKPELFLDLQLAVLSLEGAKLVTAAGLAHLRGLPLENLDLAGVPGAAAAAAGLEHPPAAEAGAADAGLESFDGMPLTRLNLLCIPRRLTAGLGGLRGLPLTSLTLAGMDNVTSEGLEELLKLPLTQLDLRTCAWLRDDVVKQLRRLPLTRLLLMAYDWERFSRSSLKRFAGVIEVKQIFSGGFDEDWLGFEV